MEFSFALSKTRQKVKQNKLLMALLGVFGLSWISTFLGTTDFYNWLLENTLVILFLGVLLFSYKRFQFSDISYLLAFVYLCLHIHGAMYTYAEAPIGYWLQDALGWGRNNYDRIVHFSFGFMLAYPMREFFLRVWKLKPWAAWVLPAEITLSFSGLYELIEWSVAALFFPEQGVAYLGTQGDPWDAQKDMGMAFLGAVLAMLLFFTLRKITGNKTV